MTERSFLPPEPVVHAVLVAELRARAFGMGLGAPRPRRIGAKVELIPVQAESRAVVPIVAEEGPATLPFLRRFGARRGWEEEPTAYGVPRFRLPGGGAVAWEPGGQIALSTPPFRTATALLAALRATVLPLREAAREEGMELLSAGIDPHNPVEEVPLRLHGTRYTRMAEHFARLGPGGARVMRQAASFQLNLDWEDTPVLRWRVLNAATPYLTALFAHSPVYEGAPTGHRSFRAHAWRTLDPARTGTFRCVGDPAREYLAFALSTPALLKCTPAGERLPAAEWIARGDFTAGEWQAHLSTLFPEVRPRGHAEIRSLDAVEPEWYAAPVALLSGLLYHPASLREADALLGAPDPELLPRAGREGLADPAVARVAADLFALGLRGVAALGERFLAGGEQEVAREFYERYTRAGRAPADDLLAVSAR
jgi:glutamate--cysteine ligase